MNRRLPLGALFSDERGFSLSVPLHTIGSFVPTDDLRSGMDFWSILSLYSPAGVFLAFSWRLGLNMAPLGMRPWSVCGLPAAKRSSDSAAARGRENEKRVLDCGVLFKILVSESDSSDGDGLTGQACVCEESADSMVSECSLWTEGCSG